MKILVAVLALGLAFWGYAFVYRGKTEPPAKYPVTNQDAAVYSLRGQIQMLSQQEELNTGTEILGRMYRGPFWNFIRRNPGIPQNKRG